MGDLEPAQERAEAPAVLGEVDCVDRGPEQAGARSLERPREPQRRLAAELDDHALGALDLDHREDVLGRQRLEVQAIGGVVVGGDRLRVAVDHHRVAPRLAHGHRRVHAAVVEFDPLPDPVRARAEDHDRGTISSANLTMGARCVLGSSRIPGGSFVGRVVVGRPGLELGCAGVHRLVGAGEALRGVALDGQRPELAQEPGID